MNRRLALIGLALLLVAVLPDVAHACPVCFDPNEENRMAFLGTTVFLTVLPLGMVGGVGLFMRRRLQEMGEDDAPGEGEGLEG